MARRPAARTASKSEAPTVAILMGSKSDWPTMSQAAEMLKGFGIGCDCQVISAHRNADRLAEYVKAAPRKGTKVFIAGAGMAAALPGVVAAMTPLPVLGVPCESRIAGGLDSLLSISQMPRGIPVGCFAVGGSGATNAALFAVAILALSDARLKRALDKFRAEQSAKVETLE